MRLVKDMSTSRAEFFRSLEVALKGLDAEVSGDDILVKDGARRIEMRLSPLPPRRLSALLQLECWQLEMIFRGHAPDQRDAFLARFDRAFQRGGG